ncbi:hypothetical protein [Streptomyces exfoliatus]|uniref:hypothetical protein n=1 Tax=Streptomyces exfoliatus TaxID=1905 RepID=UPI001FDF9758|nr:hypothetical protein [Streptomyces exfoliatus]
MMGKQARMEWWARLPQGIRDEVDGHVLRDALFPAVSLLVDVGLIRDGVGAATAQAIVNERYVHFGDRIARTPESPVDLDSLTVRAAGVAGRVAAIEAIWDGDTVDDWFVVLLAIPEQPGEETPLAAITWRSAERYPGQDSAGGDRHPAAVVAEQVGAALPLTLAFPSISRAQAPRTTRRRVGTPARESPEHRADEMKMAAMWSPAR